MGRIGKSATTKSPAFTPVDFTIEECYEVVSIVESWNKKVKGVMWEADRRKWTAQACYKGKKYNLGRFDDKEDAMRIYQNFRKTFPDGRTI